jgi:dethiobiotin synthetase
VSLSAQPASAVAIGCFVTGTDTGVGKTLVTAALLHALARHHTRVVGMKPVTAGTLSTPQGPVSEDAQQLRAASTVQVSPELDSPVLLPEPLSPHLAAQRAGLRIDLAKIQASYKALQQYADAIVVEGAGGFLVPLESNCGAQNATHPARLVTGADLASVLGLPIVLVVGIRLGCLNHALLAVEAIQSRGLQLAGWVANRIDPHMQAGNENIAFLRHHIAAPCLGDVPHGSDALQASSNLQVPMAWQRNTHAESTA